MESAMSAFFVKNVPPVERVIRIVGGAGAAVAAMVLLPAPASFVVAASTSMFVVTGLVGFCPACALAGRKLDAMNKA
jgi:hypothetical protein